MPDSTTFIVHRAIDSIQLDSIKHSIDTLAFALKQSMGKSTGVSWVSLWSAIAGGVLVISGQYLLETFKSRKGKKEQLISILSDLVKEIQILRNQYTLLAKHRVHDKFWKYSYQNQRNPELEKAERQEHLRCQTEVRKLLSEIGETTAAFVGQVAKFEFTSRQVGVLDECLEKINNLKTRPIVEDYDKDLKYDLIYRKTPEDERVLREEYFENLLVFRSVVTALRVKI